MADFCYFCKKKIGLFGKLSSEKVENQFVCGDCVDKVKRIATLYNRNFLEYSLKDMETLIENFELFERHLKSFEKIEAEDNIKIKQYKSEIDSEKKEIREAENTIKEAKKEYENSLKEAEEERRKDCATADYKEELREYKIAKRQGDTVAINTLETLLAFPDENYQIAVEGAEKIYAGWKDTEDCFIRASEAQIHGFEKAINATETYGEIKKYVYRVNQMPSEKTILGHEIIRREKEKNKGKEYIIRYIQSLLNLNDQKTNELSAKDDVLSEFGKKLIELNMRDMFIRYYLNEAHIDATKNEIDGMIASGISEETPQEFLDEIHDTEQTLNRNIGDRSKINREFEKKEKELTAAIQDYINQMSKPQKTSSEVRSGQTENLLMENIEAEMPEKESSIQGQNDAEKPNQKKKVDLSEKRVSCDYCGKENKAGAKFCKFCGTALIKEEVRFCTECGNKIKPGKKFCSACGANGNFFLYKFGDYIDEMSEKWSEDELVRQIDLLLPQKRVLKLIVTVNLYESPSTTVDFNQRVLIPHIKYEGKMKKGSIEGKGKLYASDGWLAYDGEWKKDKYNGKGILYNQDGTIRKKGTFDNEAPDEELIYSNLATASLLASDKISLEELFAVDDSDTSANTTQTATAENSNMAASIQSDAIPPEVSGCEKDGTWQKILVEATGSNATLTLWTYRDGQWEKDLSTTAAIGANGLTTDKTEGDHMTPEGTFPICFAFSTKEKNTMLYSKIIKEDSVWVCDPESVYYNTLQSKNDPYKDWADKGGAENMYPKFSKGSSNACICFGFNGDGLSAYSATPYAGSALFIDGVGENGNMNSGYGDIKISGKDMTKLLSYLCANDNPVITIKSAQ